MLLIDDFLPEGDLKEKMCREELWKQGIQFRWHNFGEPLKDELLEFCNMVWTKNFFTPNPVRITGWEYWSHSMDAAGDYNNLGFHVDSDAQYFLGEEEEQKQLREGTIRVAKHGFIYYCHKELPEGGFLEIKREYDDIERIQPVPNRLIIFDPSCIHRVKQVTRGVRRSFVCNLWDEPPKWVLEREL